MTLEARKLKLVEWILQIQDEQNLREIERIKNNVDIWDELSEAEKGEILKGIEELDDGKGVDYETVMARHRKK